MSTQHTCKWKATDSFQQYENGANPLLVVSCTPHCILKNEAKCTWQDKHASIEALIEAFVAKSPLGIAERDR